MVPLSFSAVGADTPLEWNKGADGDAVRLVSLQPSMRVFTVHVVMAGGGFPLLYAWTNQGKGELQRRSLLEKSMPSTSPVHPLLISAPFSCVLIGCMLRFMNVGIVDYDS